MTLADVYSLQINQLSKEKQVAPSETSIAVGVGAGTARRMLHAALEVSGHVYIYIYIQTTATSKYAQQESLYVACVYCVMH